MPNKRNITSMFKRCVSLSAVLLTVLITANAHAEKVVFEDVSFLHGTDGKNNPFTISAAGKYQATLVDFEFPSAFGSLGMNITKGATVDVGHMFDAGSLVFDATPGLYFANVFGIDDPAHSVDLSLYGLKISQLSLSAVPLPTSIGLFVSALLLFVGFGNAGSRLGRDKEKNEDQSDEVAFA